MSKKVTTKELTEHLQRLQAEFDNFRRRSEADRSAFIDIAKSEITREIFPILDNLARAVDHLPPELENNEWAKGVRQIAKQAESIFKSLGVEKFESLWHPFDPEKHDAVSQLGWSDQVIKVFEDGYRLGGKVIRPAKVQVGEAAQKYKYEEGFTHPADIQRAMQTNEEKFK